jgi:hypothetical protein
MFVQPVEHFPFGRVRGQVTDERGLPSIGPQLFNRCTVILHVCASGLREIIAPNGTDLIKCYSWAKWAVVAALAGISENPKLFLRRRANQLFMGSLVVSQEVPDARPIVRACRDFEAQR